jgi:adenylate cyclase
LLIGGLLIIGLYHIVIYLYREQEHSALYFGLFSLLSVIRVATTGEHLFTSWFPFISWDIARRLEFALPVFGAWFFLKFLNALFPNDAMKKITAYYSIQTLVVSTPSLLLPAYISNHLVNIMLSHMMIGLIFSAITVTKAAIQRRSGSLFVALGSLIIIYAAINDILYSKSIFGNLYLVPTGFFIFLFFQTIMLSRKFTNSFNEIESLSIRLSKLNTALKRFVPFEFLDILNKKSIIDIALGDQVQKNMTILFSDIRRFTEISEKMTPQENFNFLNSYLKRIGPIIRRHQGFIDKYIGDAVMALFPTSPEKALQAAIEMQIEVRRYNNHRQNSGYPPIAIGIGVHIGDSILGTIGEQDRLETTVIADAVNVSSRLESFTKEVGAPLIVSEQFKARLPNPQYYRFRNIGTIHLRGREKPIELFEVLDGYAEEELSRIEKIQSPFHKALTAYNDAHYQKALDGFQKIFKKHPQDGPTAYYMARCHFFLQSINN